jgi:hypothetical protein
MNQVFNPSVLMFSLASQLPMLVVCVLGLVLALMQVRRTPRIALLVVAGLALLLLATLIQPVVQPVVQNLAVQRAAVMRGRFGSPPSSYWMLSAAMSALFSAARAVGIALIAYAAFLDRPLWALAAPLAAMPAEPKQPAP